MKFQQQWSSEVIGRFVRGIRKFWKSEEKYRREWKSRYTQVFPKTDGIVIDVLRGIVCTPRQVKREKIKEGDKEKGKGLRFEKESLILTNFMLVYISQIESTVLKLYFSFFLFIDILRIVKTLSPTTFFTLNKMSPTLTSK